MKFKKIAAVLSLFLLANVAGCGEKPIPKKEKPLSGNLTIWSYKEQADALLVTADNFKKINPDVKINIVNVPSNEVAQKYQDLFTSAGSLPDIVTVSDESARSYIYNDGYTIEDVTSSIGGIKGNMLKRKLKNLTIDGKVYAYPYDTAPYAVFYRRDSFKNIGLEPEDLVTWNDYLEKAIAIKEATGTSILPVNLDTNDTIYRLLLAQLGDSYYSKDGKVSINTNKSEKVVNLLRSMYGNKGFLNISNRDELLSKVKDGSISSFIASSSLGLKIVEATSENLGKWGVMKLPAFENGGNRDVAMDGSNLFLMRESKSKSLATKFLQYAVTDRNNFKDVTNKTAVILSNTSLYNDLCFDNKNARFNSMKINDLFLSITEGAMDITYYNNLPEVISKMSVNMKELTTTNEDVKVLLQTYEEKFNGTEK